MYFQALTLLKLSFGFHVIIDNRKNKKLLKKIQKRKAEANQEI